MSDAFRLASTVSMPHIYVLVDSLDISNLAITILSFHASSHGLSPLTIFSRPGQFAAVRELGDKLPFDIDVESCGTDDISESIYPAAFCILATTKCNSADLLLVSCGVVAGDNCVPHLQRIAEWNTSIATLSPLSNKPALFSLDVVPVASSPEQLTRVNQLLFSLGRRSYAETPCFLPACFYLRNSVFTVLRDNLSHLGLTHQPWWWQLAQLIELHGMSHVISDHVYVYQHAPDNSVECFLQQQKTVNDVNMAHPFVPLRHAFDDAKKRGLCRGNFPWYDSRPVQLHIMHSWGGGLEQWVRDYCIEDTSRVNLVLQSVGTWGAFGRQLRLFSSLESGEVLEQWDLPLAIRDTAISNLAYQRILHTIIDKYGIDGILVSSLIGHSLDVLNISIPTVVLGHDYYPFCPALSICYDGICTACSMKQLQNCFANNVQNRFFKNVSAEQWFNLREAYIDCLLAREIDMIAFTPTFAVNLVTIDPRFEKLNFIIIPHGSGIDLSCTVIPEEEENGKLRVVVLGGLSVQKGGDLLQSCYEKLLEFCDIFLVGCGDDGLQYTGVKGMKVIPHYQREELPTIIADIMPEIALQLSICPETFSYTLSELQEMNIPVAATALGAFSDRIRDNVDGFLFAPEASAVIDCLRELSVKRERIEAARKCLRTYQRRTATEMVADYHNSLSLCIKDLMAMPSPQCYGEQSMIVSLVAKVDYFENVTFQEYLARQSAFLHNKIMATPQLRPWLKKIIAKITVSGFRILNFSYRFICRLKRWWCDALPRQRKLDKNI